MLLFFINRRKNDFYNFFVYFQQEEIIIWCSRRDLDPSLRLERPWWLTGLHHGSKFFYPPEKTCIIVISCLSFKSLSIGTGVLLLITTTVSGLIFNLFKRSKTVDPFSNCISFSSFILEIFTFTFTWIKTHIKNGLIKLLTYISVAGVAKLGLRRRSRKPLVTTPQEFKSPPQRLFYLEQ